MGREVFVLSDALPKAGFYASLFAKMSSLDEVEAKVSSATFFVGEVSAGLWFAGLLVQAVDQH